MNPYDFKIRTPKIFITFAFLFFNEVLKILQLFWFFIFDFFICFLTENLKSHNPKQL